MHVLYIHIIQLLHSMSQTNAFLSIHFIGYDAFAADLHPRHGARSQEQLDSQTYSRTSATALLSGTNKNVLNVICLLARFL